MNLSLAYDILRRWGNGGSLTPPGCCLTYVEHPLPRLRQRMCVQVGTIMEHRYAFWLWLRVKNELQSNCRLGGRISDHDFHPPDLLTLDWHNDVGGECDFTPSDLARLNQRDETEVGLFCWAGLRSLNDGHIAPAMWLNAIGNTYVVCKEPEDFEDCNRVFSDRYGREHTITYLRSPADFCNLWRRSDQGDGLLWDIDLDYFTEAEEVPDQMYTPMLSDRAIAEALDLQQEWLQILTANLRGITIALEPEYTGGLTNSLHLFRQWEKAFFEPPLFDKNCAWKSTISDQDSSIRVRGNH